MVRKDFKYRVNYAEGIDANKTARKIISRAV